MIDGELRHSQLFRDWQSLEQAAQEKRGDFEAGVGRRLISPPRRGAARHDETTAQADREGHLPRPLRTLGGGQGRHR